MDAGLLPSSQPASRAPHGFRHQRGTGGIDEYRHSGNGLTLLFMEMRAAPVALLMLTYRVGGRHETPEMSGASHMLEHLMFRGTPRFCRERGTSIHQLLHPVGGLPNATTWLDYTNYFSLVPVDHLPLVAGIEADRMRGMRLSDDDLETERAVVLDEHDQYTGDPFERLSQAVWKTAFANHPYARPVIGSRQSIAGFTREGLLQHYDRYYQPGNATLTILGDMDREEGRDIAERHFGSLAAGPGLPPMRADSDSEGDGDAGRRVTVVQADSPECVVLAYQSPAGPHPDTDALAILAIVLAGGRSSRLHRGLVSAGLATDTWSSVSRLHDPGLFQVQALLASSHDHRRVEELMRAAIGEICHAEIPASELDRAKGFARGALLTSRDGIPAMAMQLNEAIAAGDWSGYVNAAARLEAVSAADLKRVARRYLTDRRLTIGWLARRGGEG